MFSSPPIAYVRAAALAIVALAAVFAQNLFGAQLNAFFLRFPGIDKVLHVIEYFVLVQLMNAAFAAMAADRSRRIAWALAAAFVLALVDESAQVLAPSRSVEAKDLVADFSGVLLGSVFLARPSRDLAALTTSLALAAAGYVTWSTHLQLSDYSRALRYERQHDFVRAREHYQRAVKAGLQSPGLFNGLAWVEVESGVGDPARAVEYAERALRLQPTNPDILDTYGWALHHAERSAEALHPLQEAYRRKPDIFCIHYHLGSVYLALGSRKAAERHFRWQLERGGTREAVLARRALEQLGLPR